MKIYSMTATFGKLDHETLTLRPGLNILHAPNEWGKSTWCAFLTAMLYGLDTRSHTTKTALSDRERYTPWSGAPMSGSMDLCWQGRDITIQRKTKGRIPLGDFKAFETHTGLPVPELTAANCGQTLLGVEKSVFTRSAFLRLTDLPVTQDESLRRRLNALVTTGDDSGTGEQLEKKLRDLKNRCRYNHTGLLPQAETEAAALERKLRELDSLEDQSNKLRQQQEDLQSRLDALENHRTALLFEQYLADAARMTQAEALHTQAAENLRKLEARCAQHPDREQVRSRIQALEDLLCRQDALDKEELRLSPVPESGIDLPHLQGLDAEAAGAAARADVAAWKKATAIHPLLWLLPGLLVLAVATGLLLWAPIYAVAAWITLAAGVLLLLAGFALAEKNRRKARDLSIQYLWSDPHQWAEMAVRYANQLYAKTHYDTVRDALRARRTALMSDAAALCGTHSPVGTLNRWRLIQDDLDALENARREWNHAMLNMENLHATIRPVSPPAMPDPLTLTSQETFHQIADTAAQLRQSHSRLGQCQGQIAAIGQRPVLEKELEALRTRIRELEDTNTALTLALATLEEARRNLQRRFSPRITRRAQDILSRLTAGRYDRLLLSEDLSLRAAAQNEDVLRNILCRSDGTMDQLYLALRLAVAEALTPDAPLVLDDALVRFDDRRLASAMAVLRDEAQSKQVLLFTCQSREAKYQ